MNTIPAMTNPLGRHWKQPDISGIEIDDTHAMMSQSAFDKLMNYSTSFPSGVYPGKAWKANIFEMKNGRPVFKDEWLLRWYSDSGDPAYCNNNQRIILIQDTNNG